ncbi:MAG: ABC transporter permease [Proteobacteria bacterium]|nr:ABC transporter permease [Pseudomonadota bacterium]NIS68747.1 ABC transporter permease [Pseudomonadota bacterium]
MISAETRSVGIFFLLLVFIFVVFSFLHDQFLTSRNITTLLKHASVSAMFALGTTFVVVVGHFDISFPMVSSLAGMTTSFLIAQEIHVIPSIFVGLAVGVIFGLINGVAVGMMKLPDIVTTIGTGALSWGFAWIYSGGAYIWENVLTSGILEINDADIVGIPFPVVLLLSLYFIAFLILHRSRHGRGFYATGDNRVAATFSGVNTKYYIVAAFVFCALTTSLGAIMSNASQGSGSVRVGLVFLLPAYAPIFLGNAVFRKTTIHGTFLASMFIATMLSGFTLMEVPYYYRDLIIGIVLVLALTLSTDIVLKGRTAKRST